MLALAPMVATSDFFFDTGTFGHPNWLHSFNLGFATIEKHRKVVGTVAVPVEMIEKFKTSLGDDKVEFFDEPTSGDDLGRFWTANLVPSECENQITFTSALNDIKVDLVLL